MRARVCVCHQLKLFSVMSSQAVRLSTFVTCFVRCHVPVDGARHSNSDIDTPSSPRSTTRATPFLQIRIDPSFDSPMSSYFELRILQVRRDASTSRNVRERRNEGRISFDPSNVDVHPGVRQRSMKWNFCYFATKLEIFSFEKDCRKSMGIKNLFYYFQARRKIWTWNILFGVVHTKVRNLEYFLNESPYDKISSKTRRITVI